jgi:hypothetical protein
MARQSRSRVASVLLALVAFVLTHQLVFAYTYGAEVDAALERTGHGFAWSTTIVFSVAAAAVLSVAACLELWRLSRRAGAIGGNRLIEPLRSDEPVRALLLPVVRIGAAIALAVAAMLVVSENIEHLLARVPLPGLSVFSGPEYSGTLPILLIVAFAVAFVRALFSWRREVLVARLRAAPSPLPRPCSTSVRPAVATGQRPSTLVGRLFASRAPPRPALI